MKNMEFFGVKRQITAAIEDQPSSERDWAKLIAASEVILKLAGAR